VAPDPALAYGEPNEPGTKLLEACRLSMDSTPIFYLTGDVHHYERQAVGRSLHVIAGGGGAFLHGSRIAPDAGSAAPERVYPDKKTSLRLALGMPLRLALGTAGFLPHLVFGLLAAIEMGALSRGPAAASLAAAAATLIAIVGLTFAVRVRRQRPAATWALSILFGAILGLAPPRPSPPLGDRPARTVYMVSVVVAQAFLGSFVLGARPRRPLRVGVRQRLPRA